MIVRFGGVLTVCLALLWSVPALGQDLDAAVSHLNSCETHRDRDPCLAAGFCKRAQAALSPAVSSALDAETTAVARACTDTATGGASRSPLRSVWPSMVSHSAAIQEAVVRRWTPPGRSKASEDPARSAQVRIALDESGRVARFTILKASGSNRFDASVRDAIAAIEAALPMPKDPLLRALIIRRGVVLRFVEPGAQPPMEFLEGTAQGSAL